MVAVLGRCISLPVCQIFTCLNPSPSLSTVFRLFCVPVGSHRFTWCSPESFVIVQWARLIQTVCLAQVERDPYCVSVLSGLCFRFATDLVLVSNDRQLSSLAEFAHNCCTVQGIANFELANHDIQQKMYPPVTWQDIAHSFWQFFLFKVFPLPCAASV